MEIPATPPQWKKILRDDSVPLWLMNDLPRVDGYPHWDDLLRLDPPEGLTREQWWVRIKTMRLERRHEVPLLRSGADEPFWYHPAPAMLAALEEVERAVAEDTELGAQASAATAPDMFAEWTMREEAIASAQLAGARLTRSEALLAFDNGSIATTVDGSQAHRVYLALARVAELADEPFSPERIIELNALLTGDGALRSEGSDVADPYGRVWHSAPAVAEVPDRLELLCRFANGEAGDALPPMLTAMTVHYQAVHDQYFAEANNRTARLLTYWALLRSGFWLARYVAISPVMAARGMNYRRTFLLTDTDDGDLTYFFVFSTSVLRRAIWQLRARLESELRAGRPTRTPLLSVEQELNHRQLKVLETCLADPRSAFSYETHEAFWEISPETARFDLRTLGEKGLLHCREYTRVWQAPRNLAERLAGEAPRTVELGDAETGPAGPVAETSVLHRLWKLVRSARSG